MAQRPYTILDLLAAALAVAFATALVYFPFPNPDLYWLLATGRRMAETRAFIYQDPFTFTLAGAPWSPQSWLTAVVYYPLFEAGGTAALTALRMSLVAAMAALTLRSLRIVGVSWATASPLVLLGWLVAHTRLTDRGQLFEYVFLAGLVAFLLRSHEIRGRSFYVLPLAAQLLWVQFHASFLLGPALTAVFFAAEWIAARVPGLRPLHARDHRRGFVLVAALALACVVNPNPRAFLVQPFDPEQRALLSRFTLEWKSPFDAAVASGNFHPYYQILLVIAAVAILSNLRRPAPAALLAATAFLSFQSHRFRVEFALVAVPMIALLATTSPALARFRSARAARIAGAAALALALAMVVLERDRVGAARVAERRHPERAVAFVLEHDIAKRPFHSIAFGSYLLWDAYGRRRTFIDGRNFDPALYREFLLAQAGDDGWRAVIEKYSVDSFILPAIESADAGMRSIHSRLIGNRGAWDLVYFDRDAFVYVATASADSAWLGAHAFRAYHPATFEGSRAARADLPRLVAEMERALALDPGLLLTWRHLAMVHEAGGDAGRAADALARAAALDPENAPVWSELARLAVAAGRLDQALAAAREVVRLRPADAGAHVVLALVLESRGEAAAALQACARALELAPGHAEALRIRGRLRGES